MIETDETLFFIPNPYQPVKKVTIERSDGTVDDVTSYVITSEFRRQANTGIGGFTCKLSNIGNRFSGLYQGGDTIRLFVDNLSSSATTKRFEGRIDSAKEDMTRSDGIAMQIDGRHITFILREVKGTKSYTNTVVNSVINDMITSIIPGLGFTVSTSLTTNITIA